MSKKGKLLRYGATESKDEETGDNGSSMLEERSQHQIIKVEKISHIELKEKLRKKLEELRHSSSKSSATRNGNSKKQKKQKLSKNSSIVLPIKNKKTTEESAKDSGDTKRNNEDVEFSNVDFGLKKKKKSIDAHSLLKKKEAQLEKLKSLPEDKLKSVQEKQMWSKLNQLAQGTSVKDDVKLLKKTVKKIESEKKKSAKKWSDRKKSEEKSIQMTQRKRQENIEKRKVQHVLTIIGRN